MMPATFQPPPRQPAQSGEWVSITEYARIFRVSRPTVYKWLEAGLLDYRRIARVVRIRCQLPPGA